VTGWRHGTEREFKQLSTGATRGGIPFGRGALYYLLSNHFYIGEVKYKNEILPGEQPPILDRKLFEAARQKALTQWSHRRECDDIRRCTRDPDSLRWPRGTGK
jgi:hypothetical protein